MEKGTHDDIRREAGPATAGEAFDRWYAPVALCYTPDEKHLQSLAFAAGFRAGQSSRPVPAQPGSAPPIETDELDPTRQYIPLPGGWEVQTRGNGSSYRLLDRKTGERRPILGGDPDFVQAFMTRMALEVHAGWQATLAYARQEGEQTGPEGHARLEAETRRLVNRLAALHPAAGIFYEDKDFTVELRWLTDTPSPVTESSGCGTDKAEG